MMYNLYVSQMQMDPITPDQVRYRSTAEYYAHKILFDINIKTLHPNHEHRYVFKGGEPIADRAAGILVAKGWTVRRDTGVHIEYKYNGLLWRKKNVPHNNWIVEW